jgi:hypothetical protein
MAAPGYVADIFMIFLFVPQFVQENYIYRNYGLHNPLMMPLKVHCHGCMYTLSFMKPKMKSRWLSDQVMWVATECSSHNIPICLGMCGTGTTSHSCDIGEGPHPVDKSNCLYPAVEQGSAPAYRGTCDL